MTAPPDRMTSALARAVCGSPWCRYLTPVAWPPSMITFVTRASVRTVRFGLDRAGCR